MIKKLLMIAVALGVIGAAAGGTLYYIYPVQVSIFAGLTRNYLLTWFAPRGTTTTELNAAYKVAGGRLRPRFPSTRHHRAGPPGTGRATTERSRRGVTRSSIRSIRRMQAS